MKKTLQWSLIALLGFSMAFMSCEDSVSSPSQGPGGVLGQVTGVVFDTVTGTPIQGVAVVINEGQQTTTDANGTYRFADVPVGDYPVVFKKDGYQFMSSKIKVDPQEYIKDDPFLEAEALKKQLDALNEWAKSNIPDYDAANTSADWTYQAGTWTYGDGIKSIQGVQIGYFGLNYTYSKAYNLGLIGLKPLIGSIKGTIKLLKVPVSDAQKVPVSTAVDMPAGIDFWFTQSKANLGNDEDANIKYGPEKTTANGFEIKGVPVGEPLTFETNGFVADNYYFAANAEPYIYDYDQNKFVKASDPNGDSDLSDSKLIAQSNKAKAEGSEAAQDFSASTNVGTLYLFTAGDFALVVPTGTNTGTPSKAIAPTGTVTLAFSKPINQSSFKATLKWTSNAAGGAANASDKFIPLEVTNWDEKTYTATLKAGAVPSGTNKQAFPYSVNSAEPVGYIVLDGYAADGARIFTVPTNNQLGGNQETGLPLYTPEGIKLIDVALMSSTPRAVVGANQSVKLTFSKPVGAGKFQWGGTFADFKITNTTTTGTVEVYADVLSGTNNTLGYNVESQADPFDSISGNVSGTFEKPSVNRIVLSKTNLYPVLLNGTKQQFEVLSANGIGNASNYISFTFIQDILTTDQIVGELTDGNTPVQATFTRFNAKEVRITPQEGLKYGTTYYVSLTIQRGGDTLFDTENFADYSGIVATTGSGAPRVQFTTVPKFKLTEVNLYKDHIPSTDNYFPVGGTIELTFDRLPAGTVVKATLANNPRLDGPADVTTTAPTTTGQVLGKITIKPRVALKYGQPYYLDVQVTDALRTNFFNATSSTDAPAVLVQKANVFPYYITFTTVTNEPKFVLNGNQAAGTDFRNPDGTIFTVDESNNIKTIRANPQTTGTTYTFQFEGGALGTPSVAFDYSADGADIPATGTGTNTNKSTNGITRTEYEKAFSLPTVTRVSDTVLTISTGTVVKTGANVVGNSGGNLYFTLNVGGGVIYHVHFQLDTTP